MFHFFDEKIEKSKEPTTLTINISTNIFIKIPWKSSLFESIYKFYV